MAQDPEAIKESIRHYLQQYDIYSKTIVKIQATCNQSSEDLANLPAIIKEYMHQQESVIKKIEDEKRIRAKLPRTKKNYKKKIARSFGQQQKYQIALIKIEEKIRSLEQMQQIVPICSNVPGGIAPVIVKEYKSLINKLTHAMKTYPDLVKDVELETGIQYSISD